MNNKFQKAKPTISLSEFLSKANNVSLFSSSTGKVYDVLGIEDNEMIFIRMSANQSINWRMNLMEVYKAYINLEDFATSNFKPYVNRMHSPARGLLLHLGMLE